MALSNHLRSYSIFTTILLIQTTIVINADETTTQKQNHSIKSASSSDCSEQMKFVNHRNTYYYPQRIVENGFTKCITTAGLNDFNSESQECLCPKHHKSINSTHCLHECEFCSQSCEFDEINDSFLCKCAQGYSQLPNSTTSRCIANIRQDTFVVLGEGDDVIFKLPIDSLEFDNVIDIPNGNHTIRNTNQTIWNGQFFGIEILQKTKQIFWTWHYSPDNYSFFKASIDDLNNPTILFENERELVYFFALDWINDHIYWVDHNWYKIMISDLDGQWNKTLFESPPGEVVYKVCADPLEGFLFWIKDLDKALRHKNTSSSIVRSNLDGTNVTTIIDDAKTVLEMTLDLHKKRVYVFEFNSKSVYSCDYYGNNIIQLPSTRVTDMVLIGVESFSMASFEDTIYLTNHRAAILYEFDKNIENQFNPTDNTVRKYNAPLGAFLMNGIDIQNPLMQPDGINHCAGNNCSHICLPGRSADANSGPTFSCACPDEMKVGIDGITCENK